MRIRLFVVIAMALSVLASGQTVGGERQGRPGFVRHRIARAHRWLSRLGLTAAQRQQIRAIAIKARAAAKTERQSGDEAVVKASKLKAIRQAARRAILAVLTPEQRQKLHRFRNWHRMTTRSDGVAPVGQA